MRIVFLSPEEPFYLPGMYKYILDNINPEHEVKVIIVPPVYKGTTKADLAVRYAKTFGLLEAAVLTWKVLYYKAMNVLAGSRGGHYYSLSSVLKKYGVPFLHELDVNGKENLDRLREWKTDLLISVSCPQIFKKDLIELAPKGCLNLHGSALPEYRGVMPSFWVLANNEEEAGITLFYVNEMIDGGDVLIQRLYPIENTETLDSFIRRSKKMGAEMIIEAIDKISADNVKTYPLDMGKGSYFGWPKREDVRRFLDNGRKFR